MSASDLEQFAASFRCPSAMAEPTVNRIRQRVGTDVPMQEILAAIKKIAPSRLSTDTLVARLQKDALIRLAKPVRSDSAKGSAPADRSGKPRSKVASAKSQIGDLLAHNWSKAKADGVDTPDLSIDKFVRAAQSAAGEPKPTVARVLAAVEQLAKRDVIITPNLVVDEIVEADKIS
ncbi:MAG TPA: hypothetical protein VFF70_04410 [Anaerolineae bacterium]|nr:hypothetical protein [Anaerolineae bacterium]